MSTVAMSEQGRTPAATTSADVTGWRRGLLIVNAVIAWAAVTLSLWLNVSGYYLDSPATSASILGGVPGGQDTVLERFLDWTTYFTILSNVTAAVVITVLLLRPGLFDRSGIVGLIWRALRIDSVMMLVVTAVAYHLLLAEGGKTGLDLLSNTLQHVLNPAATALIWLVAGPRGLVRWSAIGAALVVPLAWAAYALIRGSVIGAYPYPFLDVATNGLASVLTFIAVICVFGILVAIVMLGLDALMRRVLPARQ
jgi:hypothetical protein